MSKKSKFPKPPADLTLESANWWRKMVRLYSFSIADLEKLSGAARMLDVATSARESRREHGLTFADRHGVLRPRPETTIERNSMVVFARLMRELRLDNATEEDVRLPRLPEWVRAARAKRAKEEEEK